MKLDFRKMSILWVIKDCLVLNSLPKYWSQSKDLNNFSSMCIHEFISLDTPRVIGYVNDHEFIEVLALRL